MADTTTTLTVIDSNNNNFLMFTNNPNDFGVSTYEPKNYLNSASDCSFVIFLDVKYNALENKLIIKTDADSAPGVPTPMGYDLFINRTRFNLQSYHFVDGQLLVSLDLIDDTWKEFPSARVTLQVVGFESELGCTFTKELDWSGIYDVQLLKNDDGMYYLEFPVIDDDIILDYSDATFSWYINDIPVSDTLTDTSSTLIMPDSKAIALLGNDANNYVISVKINETDTTLVYPDAISVYIDKWRLDSSITEVINGDSLFYNIKAWTYRDTKLVYIYDKESGELLSTTGTYSSDIEILGKELVFVYGNNDVDSMPNNLSLLSYLDYEYMEDYLVAYENTVLPTFNMFIETVDSMTNSLINGYGKSFCIEPFDITGTGVYIKCEDRDIWNPNYNDLNSMGSVLKWNNGITEPKDGVMYISQIDGKKYVYDELPIAYEFDYGNFVNKKEVGGDETCMS